MTGIAEQNNRAAIDGRAFRTKMLVAGVCFLAVFGGCQFPYKIDPSGNCLFVRNEDYALPEQQSPLVSQSGSRPTDVSLQPSGTTTVPATPDPAYHSSVPGVTASPGMASGVAPSSTSATGTGIIRGNNAGTLLVPGSGPIVLVAPEEQIALIGTEVILFANYKGDDDYLRIGERIEWSLGGVGHIQTTNKTQCSNILALDFNRDKKMSDRYAVTSTLHYEGNIDRGSADEQGQVPHLAGQSWISIRSAEEGTSTVTAYAPTIKDWNRRTSSGVVHWIDAEWIFPQADITKYDEPKIFVTQVKKRSSGSPCPGWVVRYETAGGPNAGLGPNRSKTVEVTTDANGDAAVELHLLEGTSGTSTVKATIVRPAGVDGGTKRLELSSATLTNLWAQDSPLSLQTVAPNLMRWNESASWAIYVDNPSGVDKPGVVTLPLPQHVKLMSSVPTPTNVTQQSDGGELVTWQLEFRARQKANISLVLQAVTDDPTLKSQQLEIELTPQLSMFPFRDSTGPSSTGTLPGTSTGPSTGPSTGTPPGTGIGETYTPDSLRTPGGRPGGYGGMGTTSGDRQPGRGTTANQGHCNPEYFANKLKVECKSGPVLTVNRVAEIEILVTNNADIPFNGGKIQVEFEGGLGFINDNNEYAIENNQYVSAMQYPLTVDGAQVAIPVGQTHSLLVKVAPMQEGLPTIRAFALGQPQNSDQWYVITGAEGTKSARTIQY